MQPNTYYSTLNRPRTEQVHSSPALHPDDVCILEAHKIARGFMLPLNFSDASTAPGGRSRLKPNLTVLARCVDFAKTNRCKLEYRPLPEDLVLTVSNCTNHRLTNDHPSKLHIGMRSLHTDMV